MPFNLSLRNVTTYPDQGQGHGRTADPSSYPSLDSSVVGSRHELGPRLGPGIERTAMHGAFSAIAEHLVCTP